MDKILLIDTVNFIWRASIGFGPSKGSEHGFCTDCDEYILLHHQGRLHCICGGDWDSIENRCEDQPREEDIIIFNFFRNLRPIIELFSPDKCFFVLEGHPQFRYDLYSEYKANRIIKQASKQNLKDKVLKCKDTVVSLLQYLPVTICRAANYEADDVIATLCENMKTENITILSNDSDYIQLLQKGYDNCRIYNPIKKEFMSAPSYPYVAWKCLNGDKSDNIKALLKPKKVEAAMQNPDVFKAFLDVEENRANFNINRQLIEFRMVPEDEIVFTEGTARYDLLKQEFQKLNFDSITNDTSWAKYIKTFNCLKY
jgi:hypothetical protein